MTEDAIQDDLFQVDKSMHLFPYWKEQLSEWPREVFRYRHYRETTGWSMATQEFIFAELLFQHGQMKRSEFRRYFRFDRRVKRWDRMGDEPEVI